MIISKIITIIYNINNYNINELIRPSSFRLCAYLVLYSVCPSSSI